ASVTPRHSAKSVPTERRWIGLHGPNMRIVWMKKEDRQTASIRPTQMRPPMRCSLSALRRNSTKPPRPKASTAASVWIWMAGEAERSGVKSMANSLGYGWRRGAGCGAALRLAANSPIGRLRSNLTSQPTGAIRERRPLAVHDARIAAPLDGAALLGGDRRRLRAAGSGRSVRYL